jgi:hypothetical protein
VDLSIIDDTTDVGNLDQLTKDLQEAVTQPQEPANDQQEAPAKEKPSDVPDKFWDAEKGVVLYEEMAKSYRTLESAYGRMANDLGTQRKLTDRLLDLKRADDLRANGGSPDPAKPKLPQVKGTELLDDPAGVISRVVETVVQERDKQVQESIAQTQAQSRFTKFVTDHPDYEDVAKSNEFQSWVSESKSRQRVSALASQGDVDSADDLLTEYKALNRSKQSVSKEDLAKEALEKARKVGLENGGAAAPSAAVKPGKVYRRADLIRLKLEKPEVYSDESFQAEILKAYAEGRVK